MAPKHNRSTGCSECIFGNAQIDGDDSAALACERAVARKLKPREVLFREGEAATQVFTVRTGQIKIVTVDRTGREHVLAVFGPGEMLGLDTLDEGIHNVSAIALRSLEVCATPKADMVEALKRSPQLGKYMTRRLIGQLREARALQVCLGTVRSTAKVAAWLSRHAKVGDDGLNYVPKNLTLADLAGVVGLAQETACRALGELERDGCIRGEAKRWVITNCDGLSHAGKVQKSPAKH
jgi:CRP-like cAMP-binding protein